MLLSAALFWAADKFQLIGRALVASGELVTCPRATPGDPEPVRARFASAVPSGCPGVKESRGRRDMGGNEHSPSN